MGDIQQATEYFDKVEKQSNNKPESVYRNWMNKYENHHK